MGVRSQTVSNCHSLCGAEGELVSVRVRVEPRLLEELLESLAMATFPINPQLYHGRPTVVEFPAYERRLEELRQLLAKSGFEAVALEFQPMLATITLR